MNTFLKMCLLLGDLDGENEMRMVRLGRMEEQQVNFSQTDHEVANLIGYVHFSY